jgi:Tfp pilus assembly protein PilF
MLLAHAGAGLLLVTAAVVFAVAHLFRVWTRRRSASVTSGLLLVAGCTVLALTGLLILTDASSRDNRWAWWLHVITAAVAPVAYAVHRKVSHAPGSRRTAVRLVSASLVAMGAMLLLHLVEGRPPQAIPAVRDSADATILGLVSAQKPFFPSPATLLSDSVALPGAILGLITDADAVSAEARTRGYVRDVRIGAEPCARCHPDAVEQWAGSAHRFSSFNNPFYEAAVDELRARDSVTNEAVREHLASRSGRELTAGRVKSQWCAGCHDPALLFTGIMSGSVERTAPVAQAGLTCLACHAIDSIHDPTGNGNYNLNDRLTDPYLFSNSPVGSLRQWLHDAIVKALPEPHRRQMLKPVLREAEFCAACHKVSLSEPVNDYRWLRGQNEYDAWHDSGVARNASRTFYLPEESRSCRDCHMPPERAPLGDLAARDGSIRSHRFIAANTALPFLRGDRETLERTETFLKADKLRVDIFALRRPGAPESRLGLSRQGTEVRRGETVILDVVVRNQGVGHAFPGGTIDSNEAWLELTVRDEAGRMLAVSGDVRTDGHLDPLAHVYKAVLVNREGRPITRRNVFDARTAVFENTIPPGMADAAHYRFEIPPGLDNRALTVRVRLLWRKFFQPFTEFSFAANPEGFGEFERVPELPVTVIASDETVLRVAASESVSDPLPSPSGDSAEIALETESIPLWERFNDYGIAQLREGNLRGASRAFQRVADLAPDRIDGPLNLARTAFREGDLDNAYAHLRRAEESGAVGARVTWMKGLVLQEDGSYESAAQAYRQILSEFPEDRATWRNLGRTHYLAGECEASLRAFGQVLSIDPEDRVSHYHQMLCFRSLGRDPEALAAQEAYERYRVDESAQALTRLYRLEDPGANLMSLPVRVHDLVLSTQ